MKEIARRIGIKIMDWDYESIYLFGSTTAFCWDS